MSQSNSANNYRYLEDYQTRPAHSPDMEDGMGVDGSYDEDMGAEELPAGEDSYGEDPTGGTKEQIKELYEKVKAQDLSNEKDLLKTLDAALNFLEDSDEANDELAMEKYEEVLDQVEGLEDQDLLSSGGEKPTRIVKGVQYFEANKDFQFAPIGEGKETVVDTQGSVTITPENPQAKIQVEEEGGTLVIRVEGQKKDYVYRIKNASEINIQGENVSGNYSNEDGRVKVGANGKEFFSQQKINEAADKLQAAAGLIGGGWKKTFKPEATPGTPLDKDANYKFAGPNQGVWVLTPDEGKKYTGPDAEKNQDVSKMLPRFAEAMRETDPKKRAELWESVKFDLELWDSQQSEKGHTNDRFNLLCKVIKKELGEDLLKEVLGNGILPREIVGVMTAGLRAHIGEMSSLEDGRRVVGGADDWTHDTLARWYENNSKDAESAAPAPAATGA